MIKILLPPGGGDGGGGVLPEKFDGGVRLA